jgi:glycosyltransferase involved in cell wall biosynthesis
MEALSCGVPLIYPDYIPFDVLYKNDFPEGCYKIDSAESFVEAVLKTETFDLEHRKKCHSFAEKYSWEVVIDRLFAIYQA